MGFFDGGGKSLSFGEVDSEFAARVFGQWRGGVITNIGDARQATDINTKKPKTWDNGDPMMQLPITLDTSRGNCPEQAESADDDLVRTLYITKGGAMFAAAKKALRSAQAADFEVGGTLYIRWISGRGKRGDPRQYELYYEAPVGNSGGFMNDPAPGGQPAAAPSMPPQQPPAPHPSEAFAAAGGPPAQGWPNPASVPPGPAAAPPQPVWNAATGQWEIPQPEPAAPPAAPPPPPQPVWDAQANAWVIPGSQPPPAAAPPAQPPVPAANGWQPGQQPGPGGPPSQAPAQPVGGPPQGGVTNPFRR